MINRKIISSMFSIIMSLAIMTGGTMAYFTASASSAENQLSTGTMDVSVAQDSVNSSVRIDTTSWQPGDTVIVPFDVNNTGSLPVHLKANVTGTWGNSTLDAGNKVKVTEVDYSNDNGATWIPFAQNSNGLTGDVYFSPDGHDANLYTLNGTSTEKFRAVVLLDSSADSTYAGQTFKAILHVSAAQTNDASF